MNYDAFHKVQLREIVSQTVETAHRTDKNRDFLAEGKNFPLVPGELVL